MGLFDNKYPYTDFHEFNADWVLSEIRKFDEYITSIKHIIDQLEDYYHIVDQLQSDMSALQSEVEGYTARINALRDDITELQADIRRIEIEIQNEKNARVAADNDLQLQIDRLAILIEQIPVLRARIEAVYKSLRTYIDQSIHGLNTQLTHYINGKVDELQTEINELFELIRQLASNVYNWNAYGYAEDGRIDFDLNNKLSYLHLGNNLSAEEYCALGLTADQYAAYDLTSWRYLMYGAKELHAHYVFMPVSGKRQHTSVALSDVLTFLCNTLTSTSYAALDLSADEYAAMDLTSIDYLRLDSNLDVQHNVTYSATGSGITADQYAHLNII